MGLHGGTQAQAHAEAVDVVVDTGLERRAVRVDGAVEEGIENVVGVLGAVAQLGGVGHFFGIGIEAEAHGVHLEAAQNERVDLQTAVQSVHGRGREVHQHTVEGIAIVAQDAAHHVVLARPQIDAGQRKLAAKAQLVDGFVAQLTLQLAHKSVATGQQPLVSARCVHVEVEVGTVDDGVGSVARGDDVEPHVLRAVGAGGVA